MTKKIIIKRNSQLPNAPLVEVVFELRWLLPEDANTPAIFWNDPGFAIFAENFSDSAKKHGFRIIKEIAREGGGYAAYSIVNRYYVDEEKPFPLWQIGHGIFASNDSSAYEWKSFKERTLNGIQAVFESYPKMKKYKLTPFHLELRYVDAISNPKQKDYSIINFINTNTAMNINIPNVLDSAEFEKGVVGNFLFEKNIKNIKNSKFIVKIANGRLKEEDTYVLESKVLTRDKGINAGKTKQEITNYFSDWLEKAHSVTSPFFKEFVSKELMAIYKEK